MLAIIHWVLLLFEFLEYENVSENRTLLFNLILPEKLFVSSVEPHEFALSKCSLIKSVLLEFSK